MFSSTKISTSRYVSRTKTSRYLVELKKTTSRYLVELKQLLVDTQQKYNNYQQVNLVELNLVNMN